MSGRKKDNPLQQAAEKILKEKNIDCNEWKKDVVNKKKLEVMSGEDKEWTEQTIDNAALDILVDYVINMNK